MWYNFQRLFLLHLDSVLVFLLRLNWLLFGFLYWWLSVYGGRDAQGDEWILTNDAPLCVQVFSCYVCLINKSL